MSDTQEFLVEIGTEELPPKALRQLMDAFAENLGRGLRDAALGYQALQPFATPRRLAARISGLARGQEDRQVEHRGPPVKIAFDKDGKPSRAATGFAATHGVAVENLERIETAKGEWLCFRGIERGAAAGALLPGIVQKALDALPIPRRMRWGTSDVEFVRPVHWVVLLLDDQVLPAEIYGVSAGRLTYGHRVHGPGPHTIAKPASYEALLLDKGHVIADFDARRERVVAQVKEAARVHGAHALMDNALLDEVTALVEWPEPVSGKIPKAYLTLPREVLVATLQGHQRYFPLQNDAGDLLPVFVAIANIASTRPEQVREGNERVVGPRLADAAFFFGEDRKRPLSARAEELDGVLFQKKLGSLADKTRRVRALGAALAEACAADPAIVDRAGILSRCDLVTGMVGEFPELQGTMGQYYSLADGEDPAVAAAIEEFYRPRHAGDALPVTPAGMALSVADRLDTLAGIFAIGQPPTGTRDPFGLRRAALGVLRTAIERELPLDLQPLVAKALSLLSLSVDKQGLETAILEYMLERLRAYYLESSAETGITPEMFDAVLARRPTRPLDFHRRILAVRDFMAMDESAALAAANKRTANILRKAAGDWPAQSDPALLEEDAEKSLHAQLLVIAPVVEKELAAGNYRTALSALAALREPVDQFFDEVMVMCEDERVRKNRLALLDSLHRLFTDTADISRLSST